LQRGSWHVSSAHVPIIPLRPVLDRTPRGGPCPRPQPGCPWAQCHPCTKVWHWPAWVPAHMGGLRFAVIWGTAHGVL
jgi:hypothetical protein